MSFNVSEEVIELYSKQNTDNSIELAKYVARTECGFNEVELSYIDRFWDPIFKESWIYLSKEIVCDEFGYKQSKDMMSHFYNKILYIHFKFNIDYKEFDDTCDIKYINGSTNGVGTNIILLAPKGEQKMSDSRGGSNKKEYIITPTCYKKILMSVKTNKGLEIRDYYSKIEE